MATKNGKQTTAPIFYDRVYKEMTEELYSLMLAAEFSRGKAARKEARVKALYQLAKITMQLGHLANGRD